MFLSIYIVVAIIGITSIKKIVFKMRFTHHSTMFGFTSLISYFIGLIFMVYFIPMGYILFYSIVYIMPWIIYGVLVYNLISSGSPMLILIILIFGIF